MSDECGGNPNPNPNQASPGVALASDHSATVSSVCGTRLYPDPNPNPNPNQASPGVALASDHKCREWDKSGDGRTKVVCEADPGLGS